MKKIKRKIDYLIKSSSIYNREAVAEGARRHPVRENRFHMGEALAWIKRAQDSSPGGGVARGYSVAWNQYFGGKGWQPPYPETTGYIIPTFFDCAKLLDERDLFERALEMADWEMDIRLENGAVRGGTVGEEPVVPSVFCTGQVIIGWVRAFQETGNEAYIEAGKRGGDFLLSVQDPSGRLVEDKRYEYANKETTAYHTRVAWSLMLLGTVAEDDRYVEAGRNNIDFNLKLQETNGWFRNNCIWDATQPLLHTICYAVRGLLEAGILLDDKHYIERARVAADHMVRLNESAEFLPGQINKEWRSSVHWSCLTGEAQAAIIWLKLHGLTGKRSYLESAKKSIEFLKSTQNCTTANEGLRGGIKGSYPFGGDYGRFQILNWAVKFFIDALLLDERAERQAR